MCMPDGRCTPSCPSCDYDLAGVAAAWRDSCPLEGSCSECGCRFWWGERFHPSAKWPRWSVEGRPGLGTAAATLVRLFRPRAFWRGVTADLPVNPRAMAAAAVLVTLLTYGGSVCVAVWSRMLPVLAGKAAWPVGRWWKQDIWPWAPVDGRWGLFEFDAFVALAAMWAMLVPLAFTVLPVTRRRAGVRALTGGIAAHLRRVAVYSVLPVPAILAVPRVGYHLGSLVTAMDPGRQVLGAALGWASGHGVVTLGLTGVWLWVWWRRAAADYLRLARPVWSVLAAMGVAFAAALVVVSFVPEMPDLLLSRW